MHQTVTPDLVRLRVSSFAFVFLAPLAVLSSGCHRGKRPLKATDIRSIVAGDGHACARFKDGVLRCWGENEEGQAGGPPGSPVLQPHALDSRLPVAETFAGPTMTIAQLSDGSLQSWGALLNEARKPVKIELDDAKGWSKIAIGRGHVCGIGSDKRLTCAGDNELGQLGTGDKDARDRPTAVVGGTDIVAVAAGSRHTCSLSSDGVVRCWGDNTKGQLGTGNEQSTTSPVLVTGLTRAIAIAASDVDTCAVLADRSVSCWGDNTFGQLGDGTHDNRSTPRSVEGLVSINQIVLGRTHTCAVLSDRTVNCWGDNAQSELADGTTTNRSLPVRVSGQYEVLGLVAGNEFSCLRTIEFLRCWGSEKTAATGDWRVSTTPTPVPVEVRF